LAKPTKGKGFAALG